MGTSVQSLTYTTNGAVNNYGHSLEYQFDWGDDTVSSWGSPFQPHSYDTAGDFKVKVRARCSTHTDIVSEWSVMVPVSILYCTLTITAEPSNCIGNVQIKPFKSNYTYNEKITMAVSDSPACKFNRWEGHITGNSKTIDLTMVGNKEISCYFTNIPLLLTTTLQNLDATSASFTGTISNEESSQITSRGVCWGTNENPTISGNHTNDGTGAGNFTSTITGLIKNTIYYVRAYATDTRGVFYAKDQISFSLPPVNNRPLGSGTSDSPYQISHIDHLIWLMLYAEEWDKHFIQTADIDASSTVNISNGKGFSPIGNEEIKFTGTYNGNQYSIDSLSINRPTAKNVGFFGATDAALITYVNLTHVNITGEANVGGLIGSAAGDTKTGNCSSEGSVVGDFQIGGLIGANYDSVIVRSYSTGAVIGGDFIGGIAGSANGVDGHVKLSQKWSLEIEPLGN